MITNTTLQALIDSPVRSIKAKVELYGGSALVNTFSYDGALKSFSIERVGEESKFFGFGVSQKINVKIIDTERALSITTANSFKVYFGNGEIYINPFPTFYVTEVHRDENTNELSVTAYDAIYGAAAHTVEELNLASYTIDEFTTACATLLGLTVSKINITDTSFNTSYESGANFDGTETIREAFNAVSEATQTIYYIDYQNNLVFKRLDLSGDALLTIDKSKYFTLDSGDNRRLQTICHATELGDNVSASITEIGTTQYVRDNPFWELRDDIDTLVNNALSAVGGLTINQFNCAWRGNFLAEIGDKISLVTKDNGNVNSFILNDTVSYDGSFSQNTQWNYADDESESAANPTSLGDALKQTYARVDKANRQIDLIASESSANAEAISSLRVNTESISTSVSKIEQATTEAIEDLNSNIAALTNKVDAQITAEDVTLAIQSELNDGVNKVVTSTGYTLDSTGLTVSKSDSEISTQITDNGMTVYKNNASVLTANNIGVDAANLHATTYLIIGNNSRFEDYGSDRTGCFFIGG